MKCRRPSYGDGDDSEERVMRVAVSEGSDRGDGSSEDEGDEVVRRACEQGSTTAGATVMVMRMVVVMGMRVIVTKG